MGLLERIFGAAKGSEKEKQVSLEEARAIAEKRLAEEEAALSDFSAKKFAEVKHLLSRLQESASVLERQEIKVEEGNNAFRRIVSTSQKNLARQLKGFASRLAPPQNFNSFEAAKYSASALRSIANDLMPYWKNIALTKLLLKEEIKAIGENLNELASIFQELNSRLDSAAIKSLRSMKELFASLDLRNEKSADLKQQLAASKNEIRRAESEIDSMKSLVKGKKSSPEASELEKLEAEKISIGQKKESIVSRFNSEIAPVEKVLKRLNSVAKETDSLSPQEKELLRMLLESPASSFRVDPKGITAKSLFLKAEKMVRSGSIALKESERAKRLEAISSLVEKDFFSDYFWELNNLQARLMVVEKKISSIGVSAELKKLEAEISARQKTLEALRQKLVSETAAQNQLERDAASLAGKLKESFNSFFSGSFKA